MKKKSKILSGILALSAVACVSLGIAFQSDDGVTASAVSGFSVNTLGYLEWTAESGATSYEVSSDYGTFKTTETKVNVGDAIMKAVNSATADNPDAESTSVTFTVTPYVDGVAGTASSYEHTITSYIDYSYETLDVADKYTDYDTGVTISGSSRASKSGLTSKNQLLTYSVSFGGTSTEGNTNGVSTATTGSEWYFFGRNNITSADTTKAVWILRETSTGATSGKENVRICYNGDPTQTSTNGTSLTVIGQKVAAPLKDDIISYSVGVFDVKGLNNQKTGEIFYLLREKVDTSTNTKTKFDEYAYFVENAKLEAEEVTEEDYEGSTYFGYRPAKTTWTIKSGKVSEDEGAPLYKATQLSLSTNGDIGVNLYVKLNGLAKENLDKLQAQLTYDNNTEIAELSATDTQGVYKISKAVAPKDIDKQITARVVLPGGPLTKEVQYSVRDYINSTAGTAQAEIANALAQYCEAVATFFDAEAEQPTLDETPVDLTAYAPTLVSSDENVVPYGMSLIVEEKTTIRFFFKVTGEMPTEFLANGEAVEAKADQTEGFYYIDLVDISAKDLDKDFEFQVGNCKVQCSALTYGLSVFGMESDSKTVNLVKALYAYNQAANEFFGE